MEIFLIRNEVKHLNAKLILLVSHSFFLKYLGNVVDQLPRFSLIVLDLFFEVATDIDPLA